MRKAELFSPTPWPLAVLGGLLAAAVAGAIGGCGSSTQGSSPGASSFGFHKAQKPVRASRPGQDLQDMVSAVSTVRNTPAVDLKFSLAQHPDLGQPLELDVAVVPGVPVPENLTVSFQVAEGLDILDGAQSEPVDKPVAGVPLRYVVKLLPKRDGIFTVTAAVTEDKASVTSTRLFAIPVIAGAGLSDATAAADSAAASRADSAAGSKADSKAASKTDSRAGTKADSKPQSKAESGKGA
ncbi:MAG TPA: hypothetical protein VLX90_00210 [Steroidobacteraceae bacterium]|nr:hypothetical protein [Steroidobacteraceae bacterium]